MQVRLASKLGVPRFCQLVFASTLSYPYLASSVSFEVGLSRYCKLGLHITLQKVDYSALQVRFDSKVWLPRNCKLGLFQKLGYPDDPSWVCFIRWVTQILHVSCASEIGLFRYSKFGFIQKLGFPDLASKDCFTIPATHLLQVRFTSKVVLP